MKINNSSYNGIFYYDKNVTYEADDLVMDNETNELYKCILESKGNNLTDSKYFTPYPDHLDNSEEFFASGDIYHDPHKNKYITKEVMQEILNSVRFGNSNGVITGEIKYTPDPDSCISYSIDGFISESIYYYDALDRIMNEPDLNNGYIVVSSNLPEIKNLTFHNTPVSGNSNLILKQYTYVSNSVRCRVQELLDTYTGDTYLRSSEGKLVDNVWTYTEVTDWMSIYRGNLTVQKYINKIENFYTSRLQEYQDRINNYESLYCFKNIEVTGTTNSVTFDKVNSDVIYVIINYVNDSIVNSYSCIVDDLAAGTYNINGTSITLTVTLDSEEDEVTIATSNSSYKIVSIYYKGKYTEQEQATMTMSINIPESYITSNSCTCTITASKNVAFKGVCYGTSSSVDINSGDIIYDTSEDLSKTFEISGLQSYRRYYFKAFAIDRDEIIYSDPASILTKYSTASVVLNDVTSEGNCEYMIVNTGGASITEYGIYYIAEGQGSPKNNSSATKITITEDIQLNVLRNYLVSGLTTNTTYTFVVYATNSAGTSYSEETQKKIVLTQTPTIELTNETVSGTYVKFTCINSSGGNTINKIEIYKSTDNNTWGSAIKTYTEITPNIYVDLSNAGLSYDTRYYFKAVMTYNTSSTITSIPLSLRTDEQELVVTTAGVSKIASNYAYLNGAFTSGVSVSSAGFIYSTDSSTINVTNPETNRGNTTIYCDQGTNGYTTPFSKKTEENLTPGTIYYFKAFASKNSKITYGEMKSFTTIQAVKPTVEKGTLLNVGSNSATIGNSLITDTNGSAVTKYGIVYIKSSDLPSSGEFDLTTTGAYNKTITLTDSSKVTSFTVTIDNLATNIKYYYRSFATNSEGTGYSAIQNFMS